MNILLAQQGIGVSPGLTLQEFNPELDLSLYSPVGLCHLPSG